MEEKKHESLPGMPLQRRDFLKGAAFGMMGMTSLGMLAGCASNNPAEGAPDAGAAPATPAAAPGTPEELAALGGSTMSLYELNKLRHELVDSKGDYTCEDGTVIPALWHKLRTLINTYGEGIGSEPHDQAFDFLRMIFTEEEAQAYLEMPFGVLFTAAGFAEESGRDETECATLCEALSLRGLLYRVRRASVPYYHHVAMCHGIFEYKLNEYYEDGWIDNYFLAYGADHTELIAGTGFYYAIPVDKSIVADSRILPLDDYEMIVRRNTTIAVSPCQCRLATMARQRQPAPSFGSPELKDFTVPDCGHPLETCLSFGQEAEYYIENGMGRQIDQEEALSIIHHAVDIGMIIQSAFTEESEVMCCCHGDCCGILTYYVAAGVEGCAEAVTYNNNSHYNLEYEASTCIKCGKCAEHCPMFAITPDKDGVPVVDAKCMRCGQCGLVCPTGSRTLKAKPADERIPLPGSILDDNNLKAAWRFDHDLIF